MVHREPKARSELIADKEKNPKAHKKAMSERWGFYRPVNEESADEISAVLNIAVPAIEAYLLKKRKDRGGIAEISVQDEFGVTFVKRSRVGKKMFSAISGGFRMAHAVEDLGRTDQNAQKPLRVELDWDKFAWYNNAERKAVTQFADSEGLSRLMEEKKVIESVLGEHGLKNVISAPNHITLLTYGRPRDNLGLTPFYKKEVLRILRENFDNEGMEEVLLDPLNVGPTYSEPCDPWERICS